MPPRVFQLEPSSWSQVDRREKIDRFSMNGRSTTIWTHLGIAPTNSRVCYPKSCSTSTCGVVPIIGMFRPSNPGFVWINNFFVWFDNFTIFFIAIITRLTAAIFTFTWDFLFWLDTFFLKSHLARAQSRREKKINPNRVRVWKKNEWEPKERR